MILTNRQTSCEACEVLRAQTVFRGSRAVRSWEHAPAHKLHWSKQQMSNLGMIRVVRVHSLTSRRVRAEAVDACVQRPFISTAPSMATSDGVFRQ